MLLKNNVEWNIQDPENAEELDAFLKNVPKFDEDTPLVIKFARVHVKPDLVNGGEKRPARFTIPNRQTINRKGPGDKKIGNETWVYCQHYEAHQATGAILTRTPNDTPIEGRMVIPFHEIDKAFFLYISPFCGNGENPPKRGNPVYVFENLEAEASEDMERERLEASVKALILNPPEDRGMEDAKIREYCDAYQIPKVLGPLQARRELFNAVRRDGIKGYKGFLELMENPGDKANMILIKQAKDAGILKSSGMKVEKGGNNWCWKLLNRDGEVVEILAKHRKPPQGQGRTDHEAFLNKALKNDPSLYGKIKTILQVHEVLT